MWLGHESEKSTKCSVSLFNKVAEAASGGQTVVRSCRKGRGLRMSLDGIRKMGTV